jgi:hypothetical protein
MKKLNSKSQENHLYRLVNATVSTAKFLVYFFSNNNKLKPLLLQSGVLVIIISVSSCTSGVSENVLDSFVSMDDITQKSAILQLERGNIFKSDLRMNYEESKQDNLVKASKIKYYNSKIELIDSKTGEMISLIDKIKTNLLEKSGETINSEKSGDLGVIVWRKYDNNDPLRPMRLNLNAVKGKDKNDIPTDQLVGGDISNPDPSKEGMKLWKSYNDYRAFIVETLGTAHTSIDSLTGEGTGDFKYLVKTKPINNYVDIADLDKKVDEMLNSTKMNSGDRGVLKQLYMELTKKEILQTGEKSAHWIGKTFHKAPVVGALASLSILQSEILSVRATALGYLASQISSTPDLTYNKLIALASINPNIVSPGDPVEISVVMGAYDSDNQPLVTGGNFTVNNGKGTWKTTAPTSDATFSGTIGIKTRTGAIKELPWEAKLGVLVSEKEASIETPEMQVFYEGIPIELKASATGMYKNVRMSVPSPYTAVRGSAGQFITVSLSGTDVNGQSVSLGSKRFIVKKAPKPELFWNGVESGGNANQSSGTLECRYGDNVPFSPSKGRFAINNYTITVEGSNLVLQGVGGTISSAHLNALKGLSGKKITISASYTGSGEGVVSAIFKN